MPKQSKERSLKSLNLLESSGRTFISAAVDVFWGLHLVVSIALSGPGRLLSTHPPFYILEEAYSQSSHSICKPQYVAMKISRKTANALIDALGVSY